MRSSRLTSAFCGWALSILTAAMCLADDKAARIDGEFIIQIFDKQPPLSLSQDYSNFQLQPRQLLSRRMNIWLYEYNTNGMKSNDHENLLEDIRKHSRVALAQFNHKVSQRSTTPNDPSFSQQWALNNTGQTGGTADADIDAIEAWDSTSGGTTALGDQIVIAVVDGGFDLNHTDLSFFKNTLETPGNSIDDDGNGYVDDFHGWNAYNNNGNLPGDNHGTHVSGICAAKGNNGVGVSGVNWDAKVMPVAGSSGNESIVVIAYSYVLEMRKTYNETDGAAGAFVVSSNSSFGVDFGQPENFPIWCAMYDSMGAAGILNAAATANLNINIDTQGDIPTACPSQYMIAVTNTTHTDAKNSGAAFGATTIDLGAPGTNVLSTTSGSSYGSLTGTSMATPHVAGAVAFMYAAACPGFINAYYTDPGAGALDVLNAILDGTDPKASLSGITVTGGRLNIWNSAGLIRQILCGANISHTPLGDVEDSLNDYEVLCTISSDTTFPLGDQLLIYDVGTGWVSDTLVPTGQPNEYHSYIPAQSPGTVIQYYLIATDDGGSSDTTDVFTFRVIDYLVAISPALDTKNGAVDDTIWYTLTITNDGVLEDSYDLSTFGNDWATKIWDETGTILISNTPSLLKDSTYDIQVSVVIPASFYGEMDTTTIIATSANDVSIEASAVLTTISAGQPLAVPFFEDFPNSTLNPGHWVSNINAAVSTDGSAEPSGIYSINLNGSPSGRDTIVSQAIDLSDEVSIMLSYYYQRRGGGDSPEPGDDLFIEYHNSSSQWILLFQHLGSGPDMTTFNEASVLLGPDAYHSAFRMRVRSIGTAGALDDDWFVDDFRIDAPPVTSVLPTSISADLSPNDSTEDEIVITNAGSGQLNWEASVIYLDKKNLAFQALVEQRKTELTSREYFEDFFDYEDIKGGQDTRMGQPVTRDAGGPDAFGYVWVDSDEPGGPTFDWVDISLTGTDIIGVMSDDTAVGPYNIGFNFPYYGNTYTQLYVGDNGIIGFALPGLDSRVKTPLPTANTPNNILAWLWDDLHPNNLNNPGGHVYVGNSSGNFVIQFVNYPEYQALIGEVITAEVILKPNGDILFQYLNVAAGFDAANCAVGIENANGTDGLEVAFLTTYVKNNLTVEFSTPFQWVGLSQGSGSLLSGESDSIAVKVLSGELADGDYNANIVFNSNDPNGANNPFTISANLTVSSIPPFICGDVNSDSTFQGIIELTYLVDFIFRGGPPPPDFRPADLDGIPGFQGILELTYMVDFVFRGGAPPSCQ